MAEGEVVKEHWLHGKCYFNVDVERESDCTWCMHKMVCKQSMEDLCENFNWGTSEGRGHCDHCLHKYTRYENRQKIPCFSCFMFEHRENIRPVAVAFEVWQSPEEDSLGFRLGFCKAGVQRQHKKLLAYLEKHHDDIVCYTLGRPINFVPISEREYEYNCHRAEISDWIQEFTMEMIR